MMRYSIYILFINPYILGPVWIQVLVDKSAKL